jgi:hypothetical protein
MIQDYFYSITVKRRTKTPDGLGGATTTYTTLGTVQGLLERSSSTERLIAAQRGLDDVYTFMTDSTANSTTVQTGDIVIGNGITAILKSSKLQGQAESDLMKDIAQWEAENYVEGA